MSENARAIYAILRELERSLDCEEFDQARISPDALGITRERRDNLLAMLADAGYISGVGVTSFDSVRRVTVSRPRITLAGLEYLEDNTLMKRAARVAKGIKDVIPGA